MPSTIIFDLDETLVRAVSTNTEIPEAIDDNPLHVANRCFKLNLKSDVSYIIIKRPFISETIDNAFKLFDYVVVWSAGQDDYVNDVCDAIFTKQKPHIVYSRKDCEMEGNNLTKPLSKLAKDSRINFDIKRAFIVDNLMNNFTSNPDNGVLIPSYEPDIGEDDIDKLDHNLLKLQEWLKSLNLNSDFSETNKDTIFSVIHDLELI